MRHFLQALLLTVTAWHTQMAMECAFQCSKKKPAPVAVAPAQPAKPQPVAPSPVYMIDESECREFRCPLPMQQLPPRRPAVRYWIR